MANESESLDRLYGRVAGILVEARGAVARTINTAMVQAYWHIGREIFEVEQGGDRAGYGDMVLERLSKQLVVQFGAGFSTTGSRGCGSFTESSREVRQLVRHRRPNPQLVQRRRTNR